MERRLVLLRNNDRRPLSKHASLHVSKLHWVQKFVCLKFRVASPSWVRKMAPRQNFPLYSVARGYRLRKLLVCLFVWACIVWKCLLKNAFLLELFTKAPTLLLSKGPLQYLVLVIECLFVYCFFAVYVCLEAMHVGCVLFNQQMLLCCSMCALLTNPWWYCSVRSNTCQQLRNRGRPFGRCPCS